MAVSYDRSASPFTSFLELVRPFGVAELGVRLLFNMIDRKARNGLAERLRHLVIGELTNFEFEAESPSTKDLAVREIEWRLAWPHYDDFHEHRLTGEHALTDGIRRDFARAILFLKTDLEYEWTHKKGFRAFINSTFHLRPLRRTVPIETKDGELRYWPFFRHEDYATALRTPRYLKAEQGAAANP